MLEFHPTRLNVDLVARRVATKLRRSCRAVWEAKSADYRRAWLEVGEGGLGDSWTRVACLTVRQGSKGGNLYRVGVPGRPETTVGTTKEPDALRHLQGYAVKVAQGNPRPWEKDMEPPDRFRLIARSPSRATPPAVE